MAKSTSSSGANYGKSSSTGNKGGVVRGQARAAQVKARNAAKKTAAATKSTKGRGTRGM